MMKKFRTIVAASLAAIAAFGVTACGGKKAATEKEDPTKTYLDVGVFDAGLGTAYSTPSKRTSKRITPTRVSKRVNRA